MPNNERLRLMIYGALLILMVLLGVVGAIVISMVMVVWI